MNSVSLIGRLTADPELRHTQSGLAMTRFSIAVDRNFVKQGEERQADFINILAWRQTAELVCKYFTKGNRIGITGRIQTGSYTAQDGSKRYTFEVVADNIDFCESKRDSSGGSNYGSQNSYQQQTYRQEPAPAPSSYSSGDSDDFMVVPNDEDLPF